MERVVCQQAGNCKPWHQAPWEIANTFLDHWCTKGHVLLCLSGELHTELADGRQYTLTPGMSYQVADNAEPHRSTSSQGATLFIVD